MTLAGRRTDRLFEGRQGNSRRCLDRAQKVVGDRVVPWTRNMGKLDQLIDEGAYLERQVFTTDVDCVQLGMPERILRKNGAERVFEHRVFKHRAR